MLTILLHSSKTMVPTSPAHTQSQPLFLDQAREIAKYVASLSTSELKKHMHVSEKLAGEVARLYQDWRADGDLSPACEVFRGDIYSGLRALEWTDDQRAFAQQHLWIGSGLYGLVRPLDGICPYRMEAAYRFADEPFTSLYRYWGDRLAGALPAEGPIVNLMSAEYDKLVVPYVDSARVITPRFLSRQPGKDEPVFVAVHAKIARGAFARWLVLRGHDSAEGLEAFDDLGYRYDAATSTPSQPVFICDDFQGLGLSQRLV